ncbi:MAG: aminotransferase class I/II-fold pyridoxal phosphate-dependent enzyme [Flavobacteriaceae bacterium]
MKKFNPTAWARPSLLQLKPYSSARDEFAGTPDSWVFLDANENPFPTEYNRYPDPHQKYLKTIIAQQKGVSTDQLLLGNGSDEVLDLLYRAFCVPGADQVITMPPTYGMYQVLAQINDISCIEVPLNEDFSMNAPRVVAAITPQTKMVFVCSPNNPTGQLIEPKAVEFLLNSFEGIVVVDEAYIDFAQRPSWIQVLNRYENLVICQTLSKAYGLASIRLEVFHSDANFLLVRVDDAGVRYRQLQENGAVVRNRSGQMHCAETLRITVGTPQENKLLMEWMKNCS